jgi:hypothetical protein
MLHGVLCQDMLPGLGIQFVNECFKRVDGNQQLSPRLRRLGCAELGKQAACYAWIVNMPLHLRVLNTCLKRLHSCIVETTIHCLCPSRSYCNQTQDQQRYSNTFSFHPRTPLRSSTITRCKG